MELGRRDKNDTGTLELKTVRWVRPSLQAESYSEGKKASQVLEDNIQKLSGLIPEFEKANPRAHSWRI